MVKLEEIEKALKDYILKKPEYKKKDGKSIIDFAIEHGIKVDGKNQALCPFHKDSSPSLTFYPQNDTFFCFGCEESGNIVWFKKKLIEKGIKKIEQEKELDKDEIREVYEKIKDVLYKYCDLREDYYDIIALWIIGTYYHKKFPTYPYLFFNAMKGSGKTRVLKLIKNLAWNGKMLVSLSEAVLFRTASQSTFCIDEFESVGGKNKQNLRELLNAAYKKGLYVERAKKINDFKGEDYKIESYDLYCPIAMANIWGMEEVLSDRCITLTLEKSTNIKIIKTIEDFEYDEDIKYILENLFKCSLCSVVYPIQYIYRDWNKKLHYTDTTLNYINYTLLVKIEETDLNGRHLELFFPLYIIADMIGSDILDRILEISKKIIQEKKEEDIVESRDINVYEFVSQLEEQEEYIKISKLTNEFKGFYSNNEEDTKWINSKWFGRSLKRLNLIIDKRRVSGGIEVRLNYKKAKEKIKMFK